MHRVIYVALILIILVGTVALLRMCAENISDASFKDFEVVTERFGKLTPCVPKVGFVHFKDTAGYQIDFLHNSETGRYQYLSRSKQRKNTAAAHVSKIRKGAK